MVAALPVNLTTLLTSQKPVVVASGFRFQLMVDGFLQGRLQESIAPRAAGEWPDYSMQVKPLQHFPNLVPWIDSPNIETVSDDFPLQQTTVTGQYNAVLLLTDPGHSRIVKIVLVQAVQAQQSQVTGQAAQVAIDDKAGVSQWSGAQAYER